MVTLIPQQEATKGWMDGCSGGGEPCQSQLRWSCNHRRTLVFRAGVVIRGVSMEQVATIVAMEIDGYGNGSDITDGSNKRRGDDTIRETESFFRVLGL